MPTYLIHHTASSDKHAHAVCARPQHTHAHACMRIPQLRTFPSVRLVSSTDLNTPVGPLFSENSGRLTGCVHTVAVACKWLALRLISVRRMCRACTNVVMHAECAEHAVMHAWWSHHSSLQLPHYVPRAQR